MMCLAKMPELRNWDREGTGQMGFLTNTFSPRACRLH